MLTIRQAVDSVIAEEVMTFLSDTPSSQHLTELSEALDLRYYIRHRIETVKRIWLTSHTDALALAKMVHEDYDAARLWAPYVSEELGHDLLFLRDLKAHGVAIDAVRSTPLFPATVSLVAWLEDQIRAKGSSCAVAYSLFVEWNADRFAHRVVEKAERQFGREREKGSRAHIDIDQKESHYDTILQIATRLSMKTDVATFEHQLRTIGAHFRAYFSELHFETKAVPVN